MEKGELVNVLGDLNVDVLMRLRHYPAPGEDSIAEETHFFLGGGAANTACVLAKLGLHSRLLASIGQDAWGEFALDQCREAGVDTSAIVQIAAAPTGLIFIPVALGGERTMFSSRGTNPLFSPQGVREEAFAGARAVHISGYAFLQPPQREAAWKAVELAQQAGAVLSLDTSLKQIREVREPICQLLSHTQICVMGPDEGKALFENVTTPEDSLDRMLSMGVVTAAVKLGSQGCLVGNKDERLVIPPFPVASLDSTGAGDSFCSGLIFGSLRGLSLAASGVLAAVLGALATTIVGGGSHLPGTDEAARYLEDRIQSGQPADLMVCLQEVLNAIRSKEGHSQQPG